MLEPLIKICGRSEIGRYLKLMETEPKQSKTVIAIGGQTGLRCLTEWYESVAFKLLSASHPLRRSLG